MAISPETAARFRELGLSNVKELALQWGGQLQAEARQWIAQTEVEQAADEKAHREQELDVARSARDAAREANALARAANDLAASANSIALAASASAERSAVAALTNNKTANRALIAAIIAILVSIAALFGK